MQRVVISEGDAAGVGREIIIKALADKSVREAANPIVCGSAEDFDKTFDILTEKGIIDSRFDIDIIDCHLPYDGKMGVVSADCGKNSFTAVKKAVGLINEGKASALCTAPVNKQSLRIGGIPFIGHTEMLASLTGSAYPLTVFETEKLKIFFYTRHIPFCEISSAVKADLLLPFFEKCAVASKQLYSSSLPLAVAALNPHGGDGGLLGKEESEIEKAVKAAKNEGINIVGPVPADSVFAACRSGKYAAVLSLYHDQGHIAAKTLDFYGTVSVTAGLPFLRTSPDHGTAFDIAGNGSANETAMKNAIIRASKN